MKWKFSFWTPGTRPEFDQQTFGCRSHGFVAGATWANPEAPAVALSPEPLEGEVIAGSYELVLSLVPELAFNPAAAIVLFSRGTGQEEFLDRWQKFFPGLPVVGGAAARTSGCDVGEVRPAAQDVAVLLISEGAWVAETLNLHRLCDSEWQFRAEDPRAITRLRPTHGGDWQPAATVFRAQQAAHGRTEQDCESITLSDEHGRNLHVSIVGDHLRLGANLPSNGLLTLRTLQTSAVSGQFRDFCAEPHSIVFGCAGLRGVMDQPFEVPETNLAGFLFGELVTVAGQPRFGNLMAARLRRLG